MNILSNKLRGVFRDSEDRVTIADQIVKIEKVTPRQYRQLIEVLGAIPNIIIVLANAEDDERVPLLLNGIDVVLEDIIAVTSVLTGIEKDVLLDEAGIDELVEFFVKTFEKNNLDNLVKNFRRLLPNQN